MQPVFAFQCCFDAAGAFAQVQYAVEDREAPFLSEEVDRFVEAHFPSASAINPTNGTSALHPINGACASHPTNGADAGSWGTKLGSAALGGGGPG